MANFTGRIGPVIWILSFPPPSALDGPSSLSLQFDTANSLSDLHSPLAFTSRLETSTILPMENSAIFLAYLGIWTAYLIALYTLRRRKTLRHSIVAISHLVPTAIALLMIRVFIVGGGGTVAQLASGSNSSMDMWRLWYNLWPLLLWVSGLSALVQLIWTILACSIATHRKWIPIAVSGLIMSAFGFFTVAANFPDA